MFKKIIVCMLILVYVSYIPSYAADGKIEGVIFSQFMSTPASGASSFDVTRAYLTYINELSSTIKIRYTSDLTRDTSGRLDLFAKYAWLEINKLMLGGRLRFGLIETPWIGFEDGLWGYRMQGSNFADRLGVISSADFGASLDGNLFIDNLEYSGAIVNGDGYKKAESDRSKRTELRFTFKPRNEIYISGFISKDNWSDDAVKPRNRYIAQLAYKSDQLFIAGDYLTANGSTAAGKNGSGYSIFGTAKLNMISNRLNGYTAIARLDQYDPDISNANDASTRYIAGISYELMKGTSVLVDVDRLRTESGAGAVTNAYIHTQIKF